MKVLKSVAKRLHINTINSNLHKTNIIYFKVCEMKNIGICAYCVCVKRGALYQALCLSLFFLRERIKTKLRIKILEKFFGRPDPRTSNLEPRTSILEPRSSNPKPRSSNPKPRSSIPNPSCSILHPRYSILRPRSSNLDPRSSILHPSSSILDPRSSILVNRILNKTIHTIPSNRTQIHVSG